jgi:D-beta-D-heptose 7-phosphate kinase/D-beta-D-heptose 1-phosphate adenosyltransferase
MGLDLALKLQRIGRPRVLVVGDYILDWEQKCVSHRFAQESPHCPVWKGNSEFVKRDGGAGAVRVMAESLGAEAFLIAAPVPYSSTKTRFLVNGVQQLRIDYEPRPLSAEQIDRIAAYVADEVQRADCVLIADYSKGVCADAVLRAAIDGAKARGISCIVDPAHGSMWDEYRECTAIKCNESEWTHRRDALAASSDSWGHVTKNVFVTRGTLGIRSAHTLEDFVGKSRHAIDPTGCGDMVLAAFGVCILPSRGVTWADACQIANAAAGLKCERRGAVPVPKAEIVLDLLDGEKIIPAELLPSVRAAHKRITFSNGCWDMLGPHHLYLLQEAKKHGDVLVVGLNDDASVRRLKGPRRPIMRQEQRAVMLAGLACVDYVVMFSEDTPRNLLKMLAPDVLVKADDPERNREGDDLAGEVVLVPMITGASTTRTLDAIRQ